jgi:hypothetical protein
MMSSLQAIFKELRGNNDEFAFVSESLIARCAGSCGRDGVRREAGGDRNPTSHARRIRGE